MDELQHKAAVGANRCRPFYAIPSTSPQCYHPYSLESNIYLIAELAQSVFERENSCILRVIHHMFYPQ